jgi:hypothetical protein
MNVQLTALNKMVVLAAFGHCPPPAVRETHLYSWTGLNELQKQFEYFAEKKFTFPGNSPVQPVTQLPYQLSSPGRWDMIRYDIINCNWVATRWQLFSTHMHTNNTGNSTKQTIHRTQKIHRTTQQLGRVRAVPRLCAFYPGICLTTEEKARKNLSQGSHT